jgi:hypothetical protein
MDHGGVTMPSDVRLYLEGLLERLSATLGDASLASTPSAAWRLTTTGRRVLTWMSTVYWTARSTSSWSCRRLRAPAHQPLRPLPVRPR